MSYTDRLCSVMANHAALLADRTVKASTVAASEEVLHNMIHLSWLEHIDACAQPAIEALRKMEPT